MASAQKRVTTTISSYWQVLRFIFVVFSLYLLQDVFYRWDGFKYYATFSEFVPSVALVTILWSTLGAFIALLVWLPGKLLEWLCLRMGWKFNVEHSLLFLCVFLLLGAGAWKAKLLIFENLPTSLHIKLSVLMGVAVAAAFLTWLLRNTAESVIGFLQRHITPLVWLFGIWFILSVPLVAYQTWGKQTDDDMAQRISKPATTLKNRPNFILVTFDSLTARDMSVYGYRRPTTPFITEWAKKASLFTRLEAESNFTASTTASLMTGKRVWTHQTFQQGGYKPVERDIENLPLLLKKNGYYTMAFIQNQYASVKALGISNAFDVAPSVTEFISPASLFGFGWKFGAAEALLYRLFAYKIRLYGWILHSNFITGKILRNTSFTPDFSTTTVPPGNVFNSFIEFMDNNSPKHFFVWIHILPPHDPYLPPQPYIGMFDSSPALRTIKSQWKVFDVRYIPRKLQLFMNPMRARYDEFITYCDKQFETFMKQLEARDILKNTIVILSADHGESFEHNYLQHGGPHLYEQLTNIPLIIKESDRTDGLIIDKRVEQADIAPTILGLAHIPVPEWMEGRSLVPLMRGGNLPSRPAFSMNFARNLSQGNQITKGTIAVWEDNYKLIHYLEKNKSLLFNLEKDPDELNNLFEKEPEAGQRLLSLIQDNLERANRRISKGE